MFSQAIQTTFRQLSILSTIEVLPKDAQMQRLGVVHHREMRHHYKDLVMNDLSRCHQIGHASVRRYFVCKFYQDVLN